VAAHELEQAAPVLRQALVSARESGSDGLVLAAGEELYQALLRRRHLDEAVPVLREVAAVHARRGPDNEPAAAWRNELIRVLGQLGRCAEAEDACRERLASAHRRRPADPRAEGFALTTLAWCARSQGRWDEAERLGREAVAVLERPGVRRGSVGWALAGLAAVLLRRMELEEAESALRRARDEWASVGRADLVAAVEEQLMDLYVVGERHPDALALSEASLSRTRRGEGLGDRERRLRTLDRHAFLLRVQGRGPEAARYELRAEYLRRAVSADHGERDGGGVDPSGPVFEAEPLPDWGLPGIAVAARAC
jgi:tetratricopeptide (TPR) repeat protein